jgi:hypothetical protein
MIETWAAKSSGIVQPGHRFGQFHLDRDGKLTMQFPKCWSSIASTGMAIAKSQCRWTMTRAHSFRESDQKGWNLEGSFL